MPGNDRSSIRQRIFDLIASMIITLEAIHLLTAWATPHYVHHPIMHLLYGIWVVLLIASGLAALTGSLIRTSQPGSQQNAGYGLEFSGWGGSVILIFWYGTSAYGHDHDLDEYGLILLATTLLAANWARMIAAWRIGTRRVQARER